MLAPRAPTAAGPAIGTDVHDDSAAGAGAAASAGSSRGGTSSQDQPQQFDTASANELEEEVDEVPVHLSVAERLERMMMRSKSRGTPGAARP